jgi:drug/metabolite transporter (DMT)-like permease
MTALATALVLSAALAHALWNYLLKRTGGGIGFVWLFALLATGLYAPIALALLWNARFELGWLALTFIVASAIIHTAYFLMLDRGYRFGDLSVVYPVARAIGPLITIVVAILVLGERPGPVALLGALAIIAGAFYISGTVDQLARGASRRGLTFALLTGCTIAAYTICDQQAVAYALVPPVLLHWGENLGRVLLLSPLALRNRAAVREAWVKHRKAALAAAVLSPLAYILVLTAMTFTPVSYVAPAREVSILFGAWLGARVLGEGEARRRLVAAAMMALGVIALALG